MIKCINNLSVVALYYAATNALTNASTTAATDTLCGGYDYYGYHKYVYFYLSKIFMLR